MSRREGLRASAGMLLLPPSAATAATPTGAGSVSAAEPCGGPYHVGDDAVWYHCGDQPQQICVRQFFPFANYRVLVAPHGEHHNSWTWTIDMSTDMSYCD